MLVGSMSQDNLIAAPACSVWQIYRGFDLGRFMNQYLSRLVGTVDFVEGDGGAGSVLRINSPSGTPAIGYVVERFRIMDDEKRIKEIEQVEGGSLTLGFTSVVTRLEIIEESPRSSIVRATVEYEIDEEFAQNVSRLSFEEENIVAEAVEKHLNANKAYE